SVMAEVPDPVFAVRAATEIQRRLLRYNQNLTEDEQLHIRTGINYGIGFRRGDDVFGDAVHVAARTTKRGRAGQILVSRSLHECLPDPEARCRPLGVATLEGKLDAEELYEVVWDAASSRAGRRVATPPRTSHPVALSALASAGAEMSGVPEPVLAR